MGGLLSYFWGGYGETNNSEPDPFTGLTERQLQLVRDTWIIVAKDSKAVGVEVFYRLFEQHPEIKNMFPSFRGVPLKELQGSPKLAAHATNVMYALSSMIDSLRDHSCLTELMAKQGENHGRRKVPEKAFWDVKAVLLQVFRQKLAWKMTSEVEKAWDITLDVAMRGIIKGLPYGGS